MARAFARIAFTPAVKAVQTHMGSRAAYSQFETGADELAQLGPMEIDFIGERDSLYQGTVGESGWPYVQHRGGPAGFLKVLDQRTLGYADFSGNRQYLSVGNLHHDDRISLFLMDYAQQRRLKIWGRARLVDEDIEPELVARLESPGYRARVERGVVITIEAFDWNCPKYITPRYTRAEVEHLLKTVDQRPAAPALAAGAALGRGALALSIGGVRQLTPLIRAYELVPTDGKPLPPAAPGAHLEVPVLLPDGTTVTRQYSITGNPTLHNAHEIAVLRESSGRGASVAIHDNWGLGTQLNVDPPINHFPLHEDHRPAVLIAGGIGITPILSMARALERRSTPFTLHYSAGSANSMPYRHIADEFGAAVKLYFTRETPARRIDLTTVFREAPAEAVFYACGPASLLEKVRTTASGLGISPERIQIESFS